MAATVSLMPTRNVVIGLISGLLALPTLGLTGCAADTGEDDDAVVDTDQDLTSSIVLPAHGTKTVNLRATQTRDVVLTVDCHPPANPDDVGPVVQVTAPTLGVSASGEAPAGLFQKAGSIPAGTHSITLANEGAATSCTLRTVPVPAAATCRAWTAWRSANADHTHYPVGSEGAAAGWEPFPASGNHWGAWAPWNRIYDQPVKTGFLLHNLEHGGLVLSYKCSSADESAACTSARDSLVELANSLGTGRIIVTPDPTQPAMFAVRAWRHAYTSDCLDVQSAASFAVEHFRRGREDIDADPPIPFDPTTLNVPCNDLMAAPDSC